MGLFFMYSIIPLEYFDLSQNGSEACISMFGSAACAVVVRSPSCEEFPLPGNKTKVEFTPFLDISVRGFRQLNRFFAIVLEIVDDASDLGEECGKLEGGAVCNFHFCSIFLSSPNYSEAAIRLEFSVGVGVLRRQSLFKQCNFQPVRDKSRRQVLRGIFSIAKQGFSIHGYSGNLILLCRTSFDLERKSLRADRWRSHEIQQPLH